jgi:hypothetical protein
MGQRGDLVLTVSNTEGSGCCAVVGGTLRPGEGALQIGSELRKVLAVLGGGGEQATQWMGRC